MIMATRATPGAPASTLPLDVLLATIPSLPRPILARLTARLIDTLDELDGDPDLEDDDPDTSAEDDPLGFDPEEDYGAEELGENDGIGPDVRPIADPQAYREHRARLRRDRCYPLRKVAVGTNGDHIARRLWIEPTVPSKRNILRRKRGIPRSPRP